MLLPVLPPLLLRLLLLMLLWLRVLSTVTAWPLLILLREDRNGRAEKHGTQRHCCHHRSHLLHLLNALRVFASDECTMIASYGGPSMAG